MKFLSEENGSAYPASASGTNMLFWTLFNEERRRSSREALCRPGMRPMPTGYSDSRISMFKRPFIISFTAF